MKALNQKADNLTKYVSIFLVLLNIVIPMVIEYMSVSVGLAITMYMLVCVPCLVSLIFAIKEQKSSKMCRFPTGEKITEIAKSEITSNDDWIALKISQYDIAIKVLEENNSFKVKDIKRGYNFYAFAVATFTIFTFVIIILGYLS